MPFSDILSSLAATLSNSITLVNSLSVPQATETMNFNGGVGGTFSLSLGDGLGTSGPGEANCPYCDQRVVAPSGTDTIDLTAIPGTLPDGAANFFQATGFALVKGIGIEIVANGDSTISIGAQIGGGTNSWDGWLSAGATEEIDSDGLPYCKGSDSGRIVSGTQRFLKIVNLDSVNDLTYTIVVVGLHS